MRKIFKDVMAVTSVAFFGLGASASHALLQLEVRNVTTNESFFVIDNAAFDTNPLTGLLNANHNFLDGSITISVGTSKPLGPNSDYAAGMDLLNVAITASKDADFVIKLTDTDFKLIPDAGFLSASVGGTLGTGGFNTAHFDYYLNTSNGAFDTVGATHLSSNSFTGAGFFGQNLAPIAVSGIDQPFSLTQIATLHVKAGQTISYDSDMNVVPEPGILALLGLGLLGLVGGRRFTKAA